MDRKALETAFLSFYGIAFDDAGNAMACGRAVPIQLIEFADELEPGVRHGDPLTGFMDTDAMRRLRGKLGS